MLTVIALRAKSWMQTVVAVFTSMLSLFCAVLPERHIHADRTGNARHFVALAVFMLSVQHISCLRKNFA
jgi:hypothetical protein